MIETRVEQVHTHIIRRGGGNNILVLYTGCRIPVSVVQLVAGVHD